jgi:hypothetical protein
MSPPPSGKKSSPQAKIVGSAIAGISELMLFHPVDTIAKRLMSHQEAVIPKGKPMGEVMSHVSKIIFRDAHELPAMKKFGSLFPGLSFAVGYKVTQRVYKFGGQPMAKDLIKSTPLGTWMDTKFGKKHGKALTEASAGCLIGLGEVVLLPLDVLKIKAQTNPAALSGRGIVDIIKNEGSSLYAGTLTTMMRNAPGSFALFGGNAFAKGYLFHLTDYRSATFFQTFVSSTIGAVCSLLVSSPMDVVKTRIQNKNFGEKASALKIVGKMLTTEGPQAFFKGLTPKVLTVGPKLVFSFTVAQWLIDNLDSIFAGKKNTQH